MANSFMKNAVANSTNRNYRSCFRQYRRFCKQHSFDYFPVLEHILVLFCTFLATKENAISFKSIKSYLSAVRYKAILKGFSTSFHGMDRLYYVLRGIKRHQGNLHGRPPRSPITTHHLTILHGFINALPIGNHDKALYWSACTLAFFGLLRISEYSCPKIKEYHTKFQLLLHDVRFHSNTISLYIKASKCDPFRQGCSIIIGPTNNILCPVQALKSFIKQRNLVPGPLFTFQDGTYLTRDRFARLLSRCFKDVSINTHSFRIGGASALAAAGIPDAQIQIMGRWSSNCFTKYIRLDKSNIIEFANAMSVTAVDNVCWTPRFDELFS